MNDPDSKLPATVHSQRDKTREFPASGMPPTAKGQIAKFRILDILGEGGMGTVYRAEQKRPRRLVALKVIRAGVASPSALRRFEIEAEALARLSHPGIAQVYEVGTAKDEQGKQPYFAMELVDGQTLREHANDANLNARERVALMIKICGAVAHAHQKGVIHRDLKPSNILVDGSGNPKVLDFGIARVTDSDVKATIQTSVGQIVGTLPYMSPEQVSGDPNELDTRSDVYALGVVLYELLSGRLPQNLKGLSLAEAARKIQVADPPALGAHDFSLRGDLETIVAKALAKDKDRRYQSVIEFQADLGRYLAFEPISARPPSAVYQLRRFARRNRAVVGGVVATVLMLALGLLATGTMVVRESKQRQRAEIEAQTAERVTDFIVGLFERAQPGDRNPNEISVREVLDLAATSARIDLDDSPAVKARVLRALGASFYGLDLYAQGLELLDDALAIQRELPNEDPIELARILNNLANLHGATEDAAGEQRQEELQLEARETLLDLLDDPEHAQAGTVLLGLVHNGLGSRYQYAQPARLEEAEEAFRGAIKYNELAYPDGHVNVAWSYSNLGTVFLDRNDYQQARHYLERALEVAGQTVGNEHVATATMQRILAEILLAQGDFEAFHPLVERSAMTLEKILGSDHIRVAATRRFQAFSAFLQGRPDEAEQHLREGIRIGTLIVGPGFEFNGRNEVYLGDLMAAQGRNDNARAHYIEAARILGVEALPHETLRDRLETWGVGRSTAFEVALQE